MFKVNSSPGKPSQFSLKDGPAQAGLSNVWNEYLKRANAYSFHGMRGKRSVLSPDVSRYEQGKEFLQERTGRAFHALRGKRIPSAGYDNSLSGLNSESHDWPQYADTESKLRNVRIKKHTFGRPITPENYSPQDEAGSYIQSRAANFYGLRGKREPEVDSYSPDGASRNGYGMDAIYDGRTSEDSPGGWLTEVASQDRTIDTLGIMTSPYFQGSSI